MKKYLIIFILMFILLSSFSYIYIQSDKQDRIEQYLSKKTIEYKNNYDYIYHSYKKLANIIFNTNINTNEVKDIFKDASNASLEEKQIIRNKLYKKLYFTNELLISSNIKQLHFHLPNNESFLRFHKPSKFGDNLSDIRSTVVYVNKNKKPTDGFEVGRLYNGYRYVYPLSYKNRYLGSVEVSYSAASLMDDFKNQYNLKSVFLLKKEIINNKSFKTEKKNYINSCLPKYYVEKKVIDINHHAMNIIVEKMKSKDNFSLFDSQNKVILTVIKVIHPISKQSVGIIIIQSDGEFIVKKIQNLHYLFLITIGFIFLVLLTLYKIIENYKTHKEELVENKKRNIKLEKLNKEVQRSKDEVEKTNSNLQNIVDERTKELSKNLKIISKYVIFSKTDLRGIITEVSDAFCDISGYTRDELIGKSHNIVRHEDMPKEAFKDMWELIQDGKTWRGEVKNKLKNGGYYWVIANISPEYNKNKEIIGYVSVRQDITAKKDFEEQHLKLIKSERMASMGEMIVNIAHQWRQPLSVISTGVTSMQMQKEFDMLSDEKFNETCEMINKNAQHLSKTIDEFKSFAQGEGEIELFGIKDNINNFIQISKTKLKDNNIEVILDIKEDSKINSYPNELIQVYINLLNNTIDAFENNNIQNRYFFIEVFIKNSQTYIKIKDNAGGIPEDIINKIFEPYFTTKHQSQGSGLGLHMVNDLVENILNGKIEVKNVVYNYNEIEYKGAEFTFFIG